MIETTMLSPLEVNLDFANPRFSMFDFTTEKEIIRYLIDFEQIKELAFQIGENGYNTIGERVIVLKSNEGNYTVLEGNRRIASLKLLFQYHSLLKSSERKKIEQLKLNIEDFGVNCDIVTEDNRDEALFKISAKHVDGIKTWSANDKRVFYFNLYSQYRKKGLTSDQALSKIKVITPEGKVAIRNAIRQLNYLTAVYNATIIFQSDLEKLTHLDTDVLVSRVLSPLSKELNLEFDDNFQIVAQNDKVYHEILGLIGKAVWIDKTLDTRVFSVQGQWNEIVKNDKVIPGLAGKIKEYKESEESNSFEAGLSNSPQNDDTQRNEDVSEDDSKSYNSLDNNADEKTNNNIDMQSKVTKYKFFVPRQSVTIKQQNYDLTNNIVLVDSFGKKVSRQSSEYSGILISCTHQNIVIQNNVIDSISENGQYTIDVEYAGKTKHFQIFLNISINTQPPEHQFLFSRQWYDESLSILSANPKYFKICGVIRNIQKYNSLSNNNDDYIILAFLLRALLEYSAKAYIDKFSIKKSGDGLSTLISTVKAHLSDKGFLNREEVKALKNTNDIETLNGLIHDFGTNISSIDVKTICSKYQKYLSVAFERLSEGENNG
ncbi:hypothetical protein ACFKP6_00205 [Streptococcus uberis]|uniref:hypothetical protein n=1 Tax=Streptococcus uberis TaxID=1349 RepID=UPI0038D50C70